MPEHFPVGGSLLAKGPVTADTYAWLNAWPSRASSLPQVMGSAWVEGLPGFRVRRKYTMHGLREQVPSHRLWVRRGLKACPGFAAGVNTQRICAGFRLSMRRPPPWRRCVSVMASFGGYGLLRRGGAWIINARCRGTIPWEGACSRRGRYSRYTCMAQRMVFASKLPPTDYGFGVG
jgi:hypothetical protein